MIVDRTNTSAETLQFLMDGVVESTITEASVGTAAWQAAIDHGFFIIFDLAMGGNYPDGISGSTTPTSATTSGASMSVGYVAVYEQGGNSTPTGTATATGTVTGLSGLCLANQNSLNTEGNPIGVSGLQRQRGPAVVAVHRRHAAGPGRLPGRGQRRHHQRHQRRLVPVQRHARPRTGPTSPTASWSTRAPGLCLTDPGGNTGARLDIETCTGAAQQQWTLPTGSGGGGGGGGGGTCGTANVALNKTATASSTENAGSPAADAVDGNTGTRWSSAFSDPQWLEVDLGSSQTICQVTLNWETAYATAFQIQISPDDTNWTTIYSTTTGTGGTQTLNVTGTGRYIRMYGTARATQYGYSLWEFQVYGTSASGGGGGTCGTANLALNKTATASSTENAGFPGGRRGGRQHRHPLVQRVLRPAMAGGRPRLVPGHLPGHPAMGGRLRHRVPDPDLTGRHELDHHLLHHHRNRRHPDPQRHRHRPLHPDVRHRPGHPVRVLAVGIRGACSPGAPPRRGPAAAGPRPPAPGPRCGRRRIASVRPLTASPWMAGNR